MNISNRLVELATIVNLRAQGVNKMAKLLKQTFKMSAFKSSYKSVVLLLSNQALYRTVGHLIFAKSTNLINMLILYSTI